MAFTLSFLSCPQHMPDSILSNRSAVLCSDADGFDNAEQTGHLLLTVLMLIFNRFPWHIKQDTIEL